MREAQPVRLQLSRKKGFYLQAHSHAVNGLPVVKVARPSKWGNPFTIAGCRAAGFEGNDDVIARRCVDAFAAWLGSPYWRMNWDGPEAEKARSKILNGLGEIRGKNLACWCAQDAPCHADVLLELANRPICEDA